MATFRNITEKELQFICNAMDDEGCFIQVIYKSKRHSIVDRHFSDESLCYLKENKGIPVAIKDCILPIETEKDILTARTIRGAKKNRFIFHRFGVHNHLFNHQ